MSLSGRALRKISGRWGARSEQKLPPRTRVEGARGNQPAITRAEKIADKSFESTCYAPTVSMYFDQFGKVRACCQNTGALMGDVALQSIHEIWQSAATAAMRSALKVGDFSQGCGFCEWQVEQGDEAIIFARIFDDHTVTEEHPKWPVQMEFSMTNSCNLQCQMCNGDWSSSIRTHREHRPPLPVVYGDSFFNELAEFLPHLEKVNFLGGEPFLGKEPLQVMSMLAKLPHPPQVAVTTNGTQWSQRIERICEQLPMSFVLSLDGITAPTYESIRIGADFDQVMANLDRFESYALRHGTRVTLAHCLMRSNWTEFAQFLRFAEDRDLLVGINEVVFPVELSLFQMSPDELRFVVSTMEQDKDGIAASLNKLRAVWDGQLAALRNRLSTLEGGELQYIRPWGEAIEKNETWAEQAERLLTEWVGEELPAKLEFVDATENDSSNSPQTQMVAEFGERSYYFNQLGLKNASDTEELVERLRFLLQVKLQQESVEVTQTSSDLIHDLVIGHSATEDARQFRIAWSSSGGLTTVFLAVRNPPPPPVLPSHPQAVLNAWCGEDNVVVLHCDLNEQIISLTGRAQLVGVKDISDIEGLTTESLLAQLVNLYGSMEISEGPSGFVADSIVSFSTEESGVGLQLRVIVEELEESIQIFIGQQEFLTG
ncbi:MAG: radical SAM protein [Microthrixaceae bacterium]